MYEHNEFMKGEWEWRISKPPTLENRVLLLLAKSDSKLLSTCCCPTQLMFACTRAHSAMKSRVCGWDGDSLKETLQLQPALTLSFTRSAPSRAQPRTTQQPKKTKRSLLRKHRCLPCLLLRSLGNQKFVASNNNII